LKTFPTKKPSKDEREKAVLIGLVELYLKTGKPVGSHTLKENGFDSLSPATLRNYFAKLEDEGFLKQHHSSGGRIPTNLAYKTYATSVLDSSALDEKEKQTFSKLLSKETREVQLYLQEAIETISHTAQAAVFLSSPRFDQDFVQDVKLMNIDSQRVLGVLITDFGVIRSEILFTEKKISTFALKRIEQFFHWKLTGMNKPTLEEEEEKIALKLYNEAMLRYITNYSTFSSSDILKTGFSKMLSYTDFNDASSLASGLTLFENDAALRTLLTNWSEDKPIKFWIGDDLKPFSSTATSCTVLAAPYFIHQTPVGGIGLLCPTRIPYKKLFAILKIAAELISDSLTKSLYKFKISYREPKAPELDFQKHTALLSGYESSILLENKTQNSENTL
jgi:heat-inducible transcriptional repressor